MKLKICGMNHNIKEVSTLHPDYLGFIFWEPSSRYFEGKMPELPTSIKKVGVFVDVSIEEVLEKVKKYDLNAVQLHGNESSEYCHDLKRRHSELVSESHPNETLNQVQGDESSLRAVILSQSKGQSRSESEKSQEIPQSQSSFRNDKPIIIKVFSIKDDFDFSILMDFEEVCDYYLFDTKGKLPGGNGYAFDWSVLNDYPSTKPYFLSGGIGLDSMSKLQAFLDSPASKYCEVIDVNSKFEIKPGQKDVEQLKEFKKRLSFRT